MTAEPVINTRPPYYAVIFTSVRTEGDNDYAATAARVLELARQQPGFLGVENARSELGLSVSYWGSWKPSTLGANRSTTPRPSRKRATGTAVTE
ncbi:antibiotic biosynthesis monooxygenase family protein [Methylogaea oryzae]|uniref:antibiotic biosynthesis monooxygenase family protein n=1 Tax=Methylogaea oryzae TaxID=1295382 RepID=UPI000A9A4782|nr:hypothetical protein [Methylogaea oryzae]